MTDSIDTIVNLTYWFVDKNPCLHIGLYNCHPDKEPIEFEIKASEQSFASCLSEDMRKRYEVYLAVHKGIDANRASSDERNEKKLNSNLQFTYGEITFEHFIPIMELAEP